MKPDKDFTVVQLGGQPELMAALKGGAVQDAMLNAEFTILARRDGYHDLVDVASLGLVFPGSGLNTSRAFIRDRRDTVLRLLAPTRTPSTTAEHKKSLPLACWGNI